MTNAELTFDDLMSFSSADEPAQPGAADPAPLLSRRAAREQRNAEARQSSAPAAPATAPARLRAVEPLESVAEPVAAAPIAAVEPAAAAPIAAVEPLEPIAPAAPVAATRHVHASSASAATPTPIAAPLHETPAPIAAAAPETPAPIAAAAAPAPTPAPAMRPRASAEKPEKSDKHGRFYRPELHSRWDRLSGSLVLRITVITVLLAGTGALAYLALTRFAGGA
ncbi:hypothetical protein SCB71_15400 [Herbiconiux sp. KACC 21604]|uniref:hypothetical protein n=1 Tax=unclassified Herbiconiux TaxID=2618217 RepID=UPI0014931208|nr:hypothetical protein [Herbiconiux sp. SALV-R1]QJU54513.1 hypothetical protein HL652_13345 [Herbiconiux sp. SALV-R1]WPO85596.1 hypothetical protein SCB71_15400 [Herbiconiux sp. KACC 21604]